MKKIVRAIFTAIMLAGCAAIYDGAPHARIHADLIQALGAVLGRPDIVEDERGITIHGAVCRRLSTAPPPQSVIIELISPDGTRRDEKRAPLWVGARHPWGCTFYDVMTGWHALAGDRLRICGERPGARTDTCSVASGDRKRFRPIADPLLPPPSSNLTAITHHTII